MPANDDHSVAPSLQLCKMAWPIRCSTHSRSLRPGDAPSSRRCARTCDRCPVALRTELRRNELGLVTWPAIAIRDRAARITSTFSSDARWKREAHRLAGVSRWPFQGAWEAVCAAWRWRSPRTFFGSYGREPDPGNRHLGV